MTIGQRIAYKRKELALSQEALGEALGVSRQAIYKWENGKCFPQADNLMALAKLFNISPTQIMVEDKSYIYQCKIYNKNVGLRQNKNVGKPTFLFCILGHIDTLLLEVFQYENQFTRRVNHHGQFRG